MSDVKYVWSVMCLWHVACIWRVWRVGDACVTCDVCDMCDVCETRVCDKCVKCDVCVMCVTSVWYATCDVMNASHSAYMLLWRTTTGHSYKPAGLVPTFWQPSWIQVFTHPYLWLFRTWLFDGAGCPKSLLFQNLKFWLFRYFGSQDTDPAIPHFSTNTGHRCVSMEVSPFKKKRFVCHGKYIFRYIVISVTITDSHAWLSQKLASAFPTGIHSNMSSEIHFCKIVNDPVYDSYYKQL